MVELVDSVEVGSRRSHLARLVGQCYHVAALCGDALAEPLLQAAVVREVCHEARRIVQLYGYVVRRERNVVVALLVNPSVLLSQRLRQLSYLLARSIHPHIHITRRARRRVGVHSRVRLTLQNTAVVARRLHLIIYLRRRRVQHHVLAAYILAHHEPVHKQSLLGRYRLRQSRYALHDDSYQCLFLCEVVEALPVEAVQRRPVQKLLSLVRAQGELYEFIINLLCHYLFSKHVSLW